MMETPGKRLPKPTPRPEGPVVTDLTHLTPEVWLKVAVYLGSSDLARLSQQCKRLRSMMHKIGYSMAGTPPIAIDEKRVPLERVATITTAWPNLDFAYTCRRSASGTFWSAETETFENVSMIPHFGGLHSLSLIECDDVLDVNGLEGLQRLTINRCNGLRSVAPLANVQFLSLEWCLNVADIAVLRNVKELVVDRCPKVSNLEGFAGGSVERLTLRKCRNVRDLQGLADIPLKVLELEQMHNITNLAPLSGVEKLVVNECPQIKDVSGVLDTPELVLIRCRNLADPQQLACFPNVTVLDAGLGARAGSLNAIEEAALLRANSADTGVSSEYGDGADYGLLDESITTGLPSPRKLGTDGAETPPADDASGLARVPKEMKDDWITAAKTLREDKNQQAARDENERKARFEDLQAEKRLAEAQRKLEAENQKFLIEAEERAAFDAQHQRGRRLRKMASEHRREEMVKAEAEARAKSEATAAASLAEDKAKGAALMSAQDKKKARIAAMMAKVKNKK